MPKYQREKPIRMSLFSKNRNQREPRFLEWLLDVLNRERSPKNAYWLDKSARIFAIRWVNAKSSTWTEDCWDLFKLWKTEGSRSWSKDRSGDAGKRMKTNFRMNLRSPNFVELTKKGETGREYPVRVFQVIGTVNRLDQISNSVKNDKSAKRQNSSKPPINYTNKIRQDLQNLIDGSTVVPNNEKQRCTQKLLHGFRISEMYPWSNNPIGATPRMTEFPGSKFWNKTPPDKQLNWNLSIESICDSPLNFAKYNESNYLDITTYDSGLQQNECTTNEALKGQHPLLPSAEETLDIPQSLTPLQEIDGEFMAEYLRDLETHSYPGCIQEIITDRQYNITSYNPSLHQLGSNGKISRSVNGPELINENCNIFPTAACVQEVEALRHDFVSSPTDSGFVDRLSTRSVSSTRSGIDDMDFEWPIDDLSEPVFH